MFDLQTPRGCYALPSLLRRPFPWQPSTPYEFVLLLLWTSSNICLVPSLMNKIVSVTHAHFYICSSVTILPCTDNYLFFFCLFFFFFFFYFWATPTAYGSTQARDLIGASLTYTTAHGNTRPLIHWARPGIEPESSWMLIRFVITEPRENYLFKRVVERRYPFLTRAQKAGNGW